MAAFPVAIPRTSSDNKDNGGAFTGDANFEDFLGSSQTFRVTHASEDSVLTMGQHNLGTGIQDGDSYKWTVTGSVISGIYDEYKSYSGSEYIEVNCTDTSENAKLYRGTDDFWYAAPDAQMKIYALTVIDFQ